MDEPLLLHAEAYWVSPWVCSAFVALTEKGLPFTTTRSMVSGSHELLPAYRHLSVTARVPALQHGDFWLSESSAMVEYLEERFPPPTFPALFPSHVRERGRARQIMAWIRSDLDVLRTDFDSAQIFYGGPPLPLTDAGEREARKVLEVAERLIAPGKKSLFGAWCIADCDFAFLLRRLTANDYATPEHIRTYVDAVWARPSMAAFVRQPRPPHRPSW